MADKKNEIAPAVQPDLVWCSSISATKGILSRCPLTAVRRCPRYYQSLYLLGRIGHNTTIPDAQNEELRRYWEGRNGWPVTDEQLSSVSGKDGRFSYHHFCPEATYDAFGYFASDLFCYADEIDTDAAHQRLGRSESEIGKDWRWAWSHLEPLHYSDCPLYSLLSKRAVAQPHCGPETVTDTDATVEKVQKPMVIGGLNKKVFIVHGHDVRLKEQVEAFLSSLDLEPIVLHRRPDRARTVIEKLEEEVGNVGYAFVLITPDDVARPVRQKKVREYRARQNVIFELGYCVGKLGRPRVCCLYRKKVTLPSDINGVTYKAIGRGITPVEAELRKELRAAGYILPAR